MNEFFAFLLGLVSIVLPGFGQPAAPSWNGYVEADYAYAAAVSPGTIETLPVAEGQEVAQGAVLFTLNATQQQALYMAATAQVDAADANLANLQTGDRGDELDVVRASLAKGQSDLELAQQSLARSQKLFDQGLIPQAQLDTDRASLSSAAAAVNQFQAQLKVAALPARDAQQIAAAADLAAAKANAEKAKADLADRTVTAREGGRIERLYFKVGETANAGVPVVSVLGAAAMKVKFYVNEADRSRFSLGARVGVSCDGCATGLKAVITHFASDPEFTPPVIYSRDERSRLVFLTEATMDDENSILPGQPVSVTLSK